ncbi:ABC transporter permease subunit [Pseudactinotalea sp. HY160]|uniref:carbohydrate ABC transporter permease n=1 Tax=Pseudactinotalea sp. HY160 TaxID=2654490 RepID=UPI00128CDC4A|nr:sugar ABC transporter permease [Pseudactinotalea sp. HY160]MPV51148.1 ABC transporter permease subunit [Pseudactinotalea sp. HY160]
MSDAHGSTRSGRIRTPGAWSKRNRPQAISGWIFIAPAVVLLLLFLVLPIIMAAWVSVSDWSGRGSPFSSNVSFVGADNYATLTTQGGLAEKDFAVSLRNNVYYVILVVPIQTALSLSLAVMVNRRLLRARGFFRTAFYFPSVTSSVAITVLFLFLFSPEGAVNKALSYLSVDGPNWMSEPRGLVHLLLGAFGVDHSPAALQASPLLGLSWWEWIAGPSVAMTVFIIMAIFTTSGTFMLLFIAALQSIGEEIDDASRVDGATAWQRFSRVTVPMLRPTLFTVITLGLIGTWQVFDQIYTGTKGAPAKTTLTPAYLSYEASFERQHWGEGAAIAFILFAIIVIMTIVQRATLREHTTVPRRHRFVFGDGTTIADRKKQSKAPGTEEDGHV